MLNHLLPTPNGSFRLLSGCNTPRPPQCVSLSVRRMGRLPSWQTSPFSQRLARRSNLGERASRTYDRICSRNLCRPRLGPQNLVYKALLLTHQPTPHCANSAAKPLVCMWVCMPACGACQFIAAKLHYLPMANSWHTAALLLYCCARWLRRFHQRHITIIDVPCRLGCRAARASTERNA
jgi:hypothetical protein